jgi:phage terminase small subunit
VETRGRDSKAEREIVKLVPDAAPIRPEPPALLSVEQAEEWRRVVDHMAPGWYRQEYHGILVAYCRQVVLGNYFHGLADGIAVELRESDEGMKQYTYFTKAAERADRAADKFGTTLRITPQSRYDANKAARDSNKTQAARPW